jgi:carboxyl-terminal processing protease
MSFNFSSQDSQRGAIEGRVVAMCLVMLGLAIVLLGQLPVRSIAMAEQRKSDVEFREFADLFAEIYGKIQTQYVDEIDNKKLFEGAINGMFSVLDAHSSWLPPEQQEMLTKDTEGEYSGVGLHITLDDRRILTVLLPIAGSPAAQAGVQPWDRIIEIEGKTTEGISMTEAVRRLTGPQGTIVKIKVWRPDAPELLDFEVRREQIRVQSVFTQMLDGGVGYLRIAKYQDDTANAVRDALLEFNKQDIKGLIIDERYNVGGLLDRVHEIADMFLEKGQLIVAIKGRTPKDNRDYYSNNKPIFTKPIIVLVNEFSASASEILAGAVQDNHRGVIMGPKNSHTYGKASVQTISMLEHSLDYDADGNPLPSGLRLTTARYYTPAGTLIQDKGIVPDIGIELPKGHDAELRNHGMLGDPSMIEPGAEKPVLSPEELMQNESNAADPMAIRSDDAPTTAPADDAKSTERMVEMLKATHPEAVEEAPKTEFRDILLDEALKYLKAILIFDSDRKAA